MLAIYTRVVATKNAGTPGAFARLQDDIPYFGTCEDIGVGRTGRVVGILVDAVHQIAAGSQQNGEG